MFSIWIPLHQFEKLIEGILLKRNPKNPTINQGNVPKKKNHQPSLSAMLPTPINKPSPKQYYKRLNIDLSTTQNPNLWYSHEIQKFVELSTNPHFHLNLYYASITTSKDTLAQQKKFEEI
jgi:hypothetical protein